jgi:hypothetical protein
MAYGVLGRCSGAHSRYLQRNKMGDGDYYQAGTTRWTSAQTIVEQSIDCRNYLRLERDYR